MKSFSLIVQFSSEDLVVELSVLTGFTSEVLKHLVWSKVLVGNFLGVHESLLDGQDLLFVEFNHIGELSFFLVQLCILFLLFPEL